MEATHDTQASANASANAEFDRGQCRINNYVAEENMSKAEVKSFTKEMIDYIIREEVEGGRDVTFEDFLDYEGVPAYGDLCGGG